MAAHIKLQCRPELLLQWQGDVEKNPAAFAAVLALSPEFVAMLVHDAAAAAWLQAADASLGAAATVARQCERPAGCVWPRCACLPALRAALDGWQAMVYAPLDGSEVELLLHHPNHRFAKGEEKKQWEQIVRAKWIDFNGGGWTWSGMYGTPQGWRRPLGVLPCPESGKHCTVIAGECQTCGEAPPRVAPARAGEAEDALHGPLGLGGTGGVLATTPAADTISRATDFLEQYAAYIHRVKPEDIEQHPYLPELEQVAADLRAAEGVKGTVAGRAPDIRGVDEQDVPHGGRCLVADRPTWRCYFCDEVFTTPGGAADHFGATLADKPGCLIDYRVQVEAGVNTQRGRGLLMELRRTQAELARYREEDTDLHREIHRLHSEHQQALRREEEKGYARGLRDGVNLPADSPERASIAGAQGGSDAV